MTEKVVIITQIWYGAKYYFIGTSNTWFLITIPNLNTFTTFFSAISQQTFKVYVQIPQIVKYGTEPNSVLRTSAAYMVLDQGSKYEENSSSHHGGMCEDGQMD